MPKTKKEIRLDIDHDNTFDEMLLDQQAEKKRNSGIVNIPIEKLHSFINHPFKVEDNEKMDELVESIIENGVLSPIVVRPIDDGYEIISGHRRTHAALRAKLTQLPCVVRPMSDEEATILMVDANIQREFQYPSERARSLKMKMDALSRLRAQKGVLGDKARELIGKDSNMSGRTVQRYLNLNGLIPELLDMVDYKNLQMGLGLEIASMRPKVQQWIYENVAVGAVLNSDVISELKRVEETEGLDEDVVTMIFGDQEHKPRGRKVTLSERTLNRYFPQNYTTDEISNIIFDLLDEWKNTLEENA